ncbi:flavin reductase family protein [Agrobacterium sp. CG160-95]
MVDQMKMQVPSPGADVFKSSMRNLAGAVCVITTGTGETRTGFTATSVTALSADGPTVMVALNRGSSSWEIVEKARRFCVNVVAEGQENVAHSFSAFNGLKGASRYDGAVWHTMASGGLALDGALASLDCELEDAIIHRSHVILIGLVRSIRTHDDARPLLYWRGEYQHIRR